jgi:long-chain acyl-CoA synthetase
MASTGETVTYRELEARSNRLAHLFRNRGLQRLDHYSIFMENNSRYLEACGAGERSGLYYTCVNSYLTASELAYILTNSQSRILITSRAKLDIAREALNECPKVELCIVADGEGESDRIVGLQEVTAGLPATPIADEYVGTAMLYSSGTTGRPKGILRPLPEQPATQQLPLFDFLVKLWHYREGMIYLSPAPLYHSAPQAAVNLTIKTGGTVIIMEASLSFLGVGVPPPLPAWGSMIAEGRSYVVSAWWLCIFPGLAVLLTVLSANILGDSLTDRLNPTLREGRR